MPRNLNIGRLIVIGLVFAFLGNFIQPSYAQEFILPAPGVMVHLSPPLNAPILKGIKIHPDNPFLFDFILDKGDSELNNDQLKDESTKLIKYFLASLTIPEKDLWVNLSPYEKDRIIPKSFGLTEMGRDLLAEDYILKQITASLIYPEGDIGKKFWKRIYEVAAKRFGTTNVPVNTFNKVWIVPEKAVVYENAKAGTAYVVNSKLKVMLEQDYLSLQKHEGISSQIPSQGKQTSQLGSQIVRELVIPELTKEINEDKNFSTLRQVYDSLILATWYKKKIRDSILSQIYSNKSKVAGINISDPQETEKIYQRYLQAFKKGVYNYIKEEPDPITQETLPRKYFSGGIKWDMAMITVTYDKAMLPQSSSDRAVIVQASIDPINDKIQMIGDANRASRPDESMMSLTKNNEMILANLRLNPIVSGDSVLFERQFLEAQRDNMDADASLERIQRYESLLRNPLLSSEIFRLQTQNLSRIVLQQKQENIRISALKVLKDIFLELSVRDEQDVLHSRKEINLDFLQSFPEIYGYFEDALNAIGITHAMEFNDIDLDLNALLPHMRSTVLLRKRLRQIFWEEYQKISASESSWVDEQAIARKSLNQMLHREDLFRNVDDDFIKVLPQAALTLIFKLRNNEPISAEQVMNLNRSIIMAVFGQDTRRFYTGYRMRIVAEALAEIALNDPEFRTEISNFLSELALHSSEQLLKNGKKQDFVSQDLLRQESFYGLLQTALNNGDLAKHIIGIFIEHIDDEDRDISSMSRNMLMQYIAQTDQAFRDQEIMALLMNKLQNTTYKSGVLQVFEYLALNHAALFSEGRISLDEIKASVGSSLNMLSNLCYYLSQQVVTDPVIEQVLSLDYPLRQKVQSIIGKGQAQILIVHNINEPMGDELARNAFLLRGLLAFNPKLTITLITNKPFLYSNSRIQTLDANAMVDMNKYKMVVYQHIPGREMSNYWDGPMTLLRERIPIFMEVNGTKSLEAPVRQFDLLSTAYDYMRVGNVPVTIDHIGAINVYDYGLRLASKLGLPINSLKESPLVGVSNQMANSWWDQHVQKNVNLAHRKVVIFNPFGGGFEQKGYMVQEMLSAALDITRLVQEGYGVVLVPGYANWIDNQVLARTLSYIHPDLRKYVIEAPSLVEHPGAMKYLIDRSDKIVAVEGGVIHLAISLGKKDINVLIKEGSGNSGAYLPYLREPGQIIRIVTGFPAPSQLFLNELEDYVKGQIAPEELVKVYIPLAAKILEIITKRGNCIFAVGGRSGVGKTSFVERLGLVLEFMQGKGTVAYIHQDERFFDGMTGVSPKNLDVARILTEIEGFKEQTDHKILLIEGSYMLIGDDYKEFFGADDEQARLFQTLSKQFDLKILLDADSNLIRDWRFSRAEDRKGRTDEEIGRVWQEFELQRQNLVAHDRHVADVIVTKIAEHHLGNIQWASNTNNSTGILPLDIRVEWISPAINVFNSEAVSIGTHDLNTLLGGVVGNSAGEIWVERNTAEEFVIAVIGNRVENVLTLRLKSDPGNLWPKSVIMEMSSDRWAGYENIRNIVMQRVLTFLAQRGFKHLLVDQLLNPDDIAFFKGYQGILDFRQKGEVAEAVLSIDKAMYSEANGRTTGGIDFTPANMNFQIRSSNGEIKFNLDPAMLQQLRNTSGFVPVIIKIQTMTNLRLFLGLEKNP